MNPAAAAQPQPRKLVVEPATRDRLAPFGEIVGRSDTAPPIGVSFYAGAVATSRPVTYRCDGTTEISLSSINPRPGEVRFIERHFQHTQTFIPLRGKPFVLVMAPPNEASLPDLDAVRAFHFDGSVGFLMHIGTWHEFPFALEADTDLVVILSAQTAVDLKNKSADGFEATGPDLQKLDIVQRAGIVFTFELPGA